MKKSKLIKALSLIFILVLTLNGVAYAQVFTDVSDTNRWSWAKGYIEKMNRIGVITGYSDATFRPGEEVTKEQAVLMISRLFDSEDMTSKYEDFMDDVGVASWAEEGIALAIAKGIVTKQEIEDSFYINGNPAKALRVELCKYLTRAMGLEEDAKNKAFINLPFKDAEFMTIDEQAYVEVMVDNDIIQGNGEGKFNPDNPVNRAELAVMLSRVYDYMQNNDVDTSLSEDELDSDIYEDVDTTTVEGTIDNIIDSNNEIYVIIEEDDDEKMTCVVDSNTDIVLDNDEIDYEDLVVGLIVEVEVTDDNNAVSVKADSIEEDYSGEIDYVYLGNPAKITIEFEDEDEDEDKVDKTFYISEDVEVLLDNEDADMDDLNDGDMVDIEVKNSWVTKIDAESKNKHIEGIVQNIEFDSEPKLTIKDEDDNTYEYPVDDDVDIERNDRNADITDLKIGDEVEVDVEYNVIKDIEAEIVEKDDEGTIKSILISDKPELTIKNEDGDIVKYLVSNDTDIELDNKSSTIYDLRLGFKVELEIESNEIVEIESESRDNLNRYEGTVKYINKDAEVITVEVINSSTDEEEVIRIDVTDDTNFIDTDGDRTSLRRLDEGDEVLVMGDYDGGIFTAKTVIIVQKND